MSHIPLPSAATQPDDTLAAMQRDPATRAHMTWVRTVATVEPVRYRLASTHTA